VVFVYSFEEQLKKGKLAEQHFFEFLKKRGVSPEFNNYNGNNADYDIIAKGKKYEVKCDFYDNQSFPLEIIHIGLLFKKGWLFTTESDYIVFYKEKAQKIYIFKTDLLRKFYISNFGRIDKYKATANREFVTFNFLTDLDELDKENVLLITIDY